jgi:hypothetical protein
MRYLLIPTSDTALNVGGIVGECDVDTLTDGQRDALAQAFERTIETCELLVAYAVGVAGKPSKQ